MSEVSTDGERVGIVGLGGGSNARSEVDSALRALATTTGKGRRGRSEIAAANVRPSAIALWRSARTRLPLVLSDVFSVVAGGLIADLITRLLMHNAVRPAEQALVLASLVAGYALAGLYGGLGLHEVVELRRIVQVSTLVLLTVACASILTLPVAIWCAAVWVSAVLIVPLARALVRYWCAKQSWWGLPTLIIGIGSQADAAAQVLRDNPECGLRPAGITGPAGPQEPSALAILNDPETLRAFVHARAIRHAVVAMPELSASQLAETVEQYRNLVPRLLVMNEHAVVPGIWAEARSCGRWSGIEVHNRLPLLRLQALKRAMDLVLASAALILGLPLMIVIAAAIRLTSRGPATYEHARIGLGGRVFSTWKFRTMYCDSAEMLQRHFERDPAARDEWDRDCKLRDDPRVTPVGRFLRKWSLDELPQLWNVVRGDMSLVGPRPIITDEIIKYGDVFTLYKSIKPGLTGLWQVSGRNDITYEDRVDIDQYYIRNWSPWLDLYILPQTVVAMLRRTGAY
jgi:Undecaprenyl-phosphate galactose phosphotransferase WbaP